MSIRITIACPSCDRRCDGDLVNTGGDIEYQDVTVDCPECGVGVIRL